jgi:hypothetical protein
MTGFSHMFFQNILGLLIGRLPRRHFNFTFLSREKAKKIPFCYPTFHIFPHAGSGHCLHHIL